MAKKNIHCKFCEIAQGLDSTRLLHSDNLIVAFADINPAAFRHYLVIPKNHISTVNSLEKGEAHYNLVNHMFETGKTLLQESAPLAEHRFGFHRPPFNSVNHLHLHCLALPFAPMWKQIKYLPNDPFGFMTVDELTKKLDPLHR